MRRRPPCFCDLELSNITKRKSYYSEHPKTPNTQPVFTWYRELKQDETQHTLKFPKNIDPSVYTFSVFGNHGIHPSNFSHNHHDIVTIEIISTHNPGDIIIIIVIIFIRQVSLQYPIYDCIIIIIIILFIKSFILAQ